MPSIFVDRAPLAVTDGEPLGQYLSGILLAECSSKEPGNAGPGPGEAFSSLRGETILQLCALPTTYRILYSWVEPRDRTLFPWPQELTTGHIVRPTR
jgi:hypothetical protein